MVGILVFQFVFVICFPYCSLFLGFCGSLQWSVTDFVNQRIESANANVSFESASSIKCIQFIVVFSSLITPI
jgi:hypothetical protein